MSPLSSSHGTIRFGDFDVDLRSGELRKHGVRIKLQVQPFQVLQILLEHAGEVVPREQLGKKVWPADTFVDFDHGLNNAVKKLRDALMDDAEKPRFIETLVNIADGYHLWSVRYEREMKDVFDIQDDIARSIVDRLKGTFAGNSQEPLVKAGTKNLEAYEASAGRARTALFRYILKVFRPFGSSRDTRRECLQVQPCQTI